MKEVRIPKAGKVLQTEQEYSENNSEYSMRSCDMSEFSTSGYVNVDI